MNTQTDYKPYTGLKQIFFVRGHLWAVEIFFDKVRKEGGNQFFWYDQFALMVNGWNLRVSPAKLMEYFLNEIGKA